MALHLTAERATGKHANADRADAGLMRTRHEALVVLRGIVGRQCLDRRGIERVHADLCGIHDAGRNNLVDFADVAERGETEIADLAGIAQLLECGHDLAENERRGQRLAAGIRRQRIVELIEVDAVTPHALQAFVERGIDAGSDPAAIGTRHAHLGADQRLGLQLLEQLSEVDLGCAIAVARRSVEEVHAVLERHGGGALLLGFIGLHHQPADGTAAEGEHRYLLAGSTQRSFLDHAFLQLFVRL